MSANQDYKKIPTEAPSIEHGDTFDFSVLQRLLNDSAVYQCFRAGIMLESFMNLAGLDQLKNQMARIKDDPSLKPILDDIKSSGPSAMIKYWNDPNMLQKLGQALGVVGMGSSNALGSEEANIDEAVYADPFLHNAAGFGDAKALKEALAAGADKDEKDEEGRTALHFACGFGKVECAEILLEAGARIDALDLNKHTTLHYAAGYGHAECVKLLLKSGAAVNPRDVNGLTPTDVAKLKKYDHVVRLLKKDELSTLVIAIVACVIPFSIYLFCTLFD